MPNDFLTRLESLMERATKGPWQCIAINKTVWVDDEHSRPIIHWSGFDASACDYAESVRNAELIALIRNHAPAIAEVVRAVQPVVKGFTLQICDAVDDDELRGVRKQSIVLSLNEIRAILRALAALNAGKMEGE